MELTEEDLKNMTPEQIAELQKKNCIFCHIVAGRVSSKKVYEDDRCLAILDINPANPGHILLLPKEHFQIMPLVPEELIAHLLIIAKHLSQSQLRALKAQGTTIMIANGLVAGQRAPHFMLHIIPRKENDGVGFEYQASSMQEADLKKLASTLKKRINSLFGTDKKEPINLDSSPAKIKAGTVDAEFSDIKEPKEAQSPARKAEARAEAEPAEEEPEVPEQQEQRQKPQQEELPEETEGSAEEKPEPKAMPTKKTSRKSSSAPKAKKSAPEKNPPVSSPESETESPPQDGQPNLDLISRLF
jgi:histidine triad (HIT) family protein